MTFLILSTLTMAVAICFVPAYLMRRRAVSRTQDFVISSQPATPGVIQNSSTAYALKLIIFGEKDEAQVVDQKVVDQKVVDQKVIRPA